MSPMLCTLLVGLGAVAVFGIWGILFDRYVSGVWPWQQK